MITLASNYPTH